MYNKKIRQPPGVFFLYCLL